MLSLVIFSDWAIRKWIIENCGTYASLRGNSIRNSKENNKKMMKIKSSEWDKKNMLEVIWTNKSKKNNKKEIMKIN